MSINIGGYSRCCGERLIFCSAKSILLFCLCHFFACPKKARLSINPAIWPSNCGGAKKTRRHRFSLNPPPFEPNRGFSKADFSGLQPLTRRERCLFDCQSADAEFFEWFGYTVPANNGENTQNFTFSSDDLYMYSLH
jgi:hypothetical protein